MRNILEQAQSDPRALQDHMKVRASPLRAQPSSLPPSPLTRPPCLRSSQSPLIRQKIQKLEAAGVIRLGSR